MGIQGLSCMAFSGSFGRFVMFHCFFCRQDSRLYLIYIYMGYGILQGHGVDFLAFKLQSLRRNAKQHPPNKTPKTPNKT